MKIFVATSFSSLADTEGKVDESHQQRVTKLLDKLRQNDDEVFCAVEAYGWKLGNQEADDAVREDTRRIDASDVVVALLTSTGSAGVNFEIGYAVKAGKRVILVQEEGSELRWFNQGLINAGLAELATSEDVAKILSKS